MFSKKMLANRAFSFGCAFTLAAAMLTGCGTKSANSTAASQSAGKDGPIKISLMTMLYTDPPSADNRILKDMERITNSTMDISWAPSASYSDKFSVTIASGQMPMCILISDDRNSSYLSGCRQGAFWDLTNYIKDYPNLYGNLKQMWDNSMIDGKNYIIPRSRESGRAGLMYRSDWLKNLGLKEPTNLEELTNVIKAFTHNDPDKNGKNDTFGLILDQSAGGVSKGDPMTSTLSSWFGASTTWGVDSSGKVHPAFEEKEYIDSLKWLRDLYADKCINQDFAVVPDIKALYSKGNAGTYFGTNDDINSPQAMTDLPKNIPGATTDALIKISGPKGIRAPYWGSGYAGGYAISKSAVKTEADLRKVLSFWDKVNSKEMINLMAYGQQGTDYNLQDGKVARSTEQKSKFTSDYGSLGQLGAGGTSWTGVTYDELNADMRATNYRAEVAKFVVPNPVLSVVSSTYSDKNGDLTKMVLDARVKFIMGTLDEAGYNEVIKKWHSSGGDQACTEFAEGYAKLKK